MLIERVVTGIDILGKGDENDPFLIRTDMREPIVIVIKGELNRVFAVRIHSPNAIAAKRFYPAGRSSGAISGAGAIDALTEIDDLKTEQAFYLRGA